MTINYVCNECGKRYSPYDFPYICSCGGMLNLEDFPREFSMDKILKK